MHKCLFMKTFHRKLLRERALPKLYEHSLRPSASTLIPHIAVYEPPSLHLQPHPHHCEVSDDTTVGGLTSGRDLSSYRNEVEQLVWLHEENNLLLNITKTKELKMYFRRKKTDSILLSTRGLCRQANCLLGHQMKEGFYGEQNTSELLKEKPSKYLTSSLH